MSRKLVSTLVTLLVITLVLVTSLSLAGCTKAVVAPTTPAHQPKVLELRGGQFGVSGYLQGIAIETIMQESKHPWLSAAAMETVGGEENVTTLCDKLSSDKKRRTVTIIGESTVSMAYQGVKPFTKSYKGTLTGVFFGSAVISLICTLNPNIKTPSDLVGKRIAFPRTTSTIYGRVTPIFKDVWHILDKVKVETMDWGDQAAALIDGRVDALLTAGYVYKGKYLPIAGQEELFQTKKVYPIAAAKEDWASLGKVLGVPRLISQKSPRVPWAHSRPVLFIPTYRGVAGGRTGTLNLT